PISVYEIHPGSWKRVTDEKDGNRFLTYRELAHSICDYVKDMGFTHVEFLPVMEHPFYGSWGYQSLGYFAPTSRYGTPQDFMYLVDYLHRNEIGVILDWVPSHFPTDNHGLGMFDGTHLYEHADPRKGFHPDWKSYIFNYSRNEVRSFLISSALFWLDKYHVDSLRVDAVASMLYLDYSRNHGEWIPNNFGGRENQEAISLIKLVNEKAYEKFHGIQMIAEESTAWPMVSKPVDTGGLGFGMKWNMGWMNDTLSYFSKDPIYRKYHQNQLTFSLWYAFTENFMLPLSHDEVVHGKGSLIGKMPGDDWQKFANLRSLFGYMYGHPGKKLCFMGNEFGQRNEWDHSNSLDWHLTQYKDHKGIQKWLKDLNNLYKNEPCLYELDFSYDGFEWVDFNDSGSSVISFIRKSKSDEKLLIVCNFTPAVRYNYRIGVPEAGFWREILNSDSKIYGGSGCSNSERIESESKPANARDASISLTLPPLGVLFLKLD
ncbi:MAG: 1,4-alpha-glucan branching protein GlgB, partial [Thermodesulfobacteriota bacterium]